MSFPRLDVACGGVLLPGGALLVVGCHCQVEQGVITRWDVWWGVLARQFKQCVYEHGFGVYGDNTVAWCRGWLCTLYF